VIKGHPPVSDIYATRLQAEGVIDANWAGEHAMRFVASSNRNSKRRRL
jgi:2-oxoglutarate dehydrogenase E1 component